MVKFLFSNVKAIRHDASILISDCKVLFTCFRIYFWMTIWLLCLMCSIKKSNKMEPDYDLGFWEGG